MRYMVERNFVQVLGVIWMPAITCAQEIKLRAYDVENIGEFTRENVSDWIDKNAGDFQSITDFYATMGDVEIHWANEDNEITYNDCMYPQED